MAVTPGLPRPHVPFAPMLRLGRIAWRLLPWLALAGVLVLAAWRLQPPANLRLLVHVTAVSLVGYGLVTALVAEILSPNRAQLRVVPLSDQRARQLTTTARALLFVVLLTELGAWFVKVYDWHPSVAYLLQILRNVVLVLLAGAVLAWSGVLARLRALSSRSYLGLAAHVTTRFLVPLAFLTALFLAVTRGLGYVPLSRYVFENAIEMGLKIVAAALGYRYLTGVFRASVVMGRAADTGGVPGEAEIGAERIGTSLIRMGVFAAAILWILWGWGIGPSELVASLEKPVFGGSGVTWGTLLEGLGLVALVLVVGGLLRDVLTFFVFPRSHVDVGARYAILAVLRYVVIALAFVFGLSAFGLDTDSLAWFFGLAGVGLGFGLQDIVANFFSGVILLLERPIRVGDVIQVGDTTGTVEEIRMRGTTIRTLDRMPVVIPNREMLGERITHLSRHFNVARMRVEVGISYDDDPREASTILLDVAREHPSVLADPAPIVLFERYGESSLDLVLLCFTNEVGNRFAHAAEIRLRVLERFREAGIEIPFPQRDLHLRDGWPGSA